MEKLGDNTNYEELEGIPDIETIPDHIFKAFAENGLLIGALENDEVVGYTILMDEMESDQLYLHAIGVKSEYAGEGIGEEIMKRIRKEVLENDQISSDTIEWTYDPLLGANAKLYIQKLGGKSN